MKQSSCSSYSNQEPRCLTYKKRSSWRRRPVKSPLTLNRIYLFAARHALRLTSAPPAIQLLFVSFICFLSSLMIADALNCNLANSAHNQTSLMARAVHQMQGIRVVHMDMECVTFSPNAIRGHSSFQRAFGSVCHRLLRRKILYRKHF